MNIFTIYKNKIFNILKDLNRKNKIILPENLNSINVDIPPKNFDADISTNVCMILAKKNNKKPEEISNLIIDDLSKQDKNILSSEFVNPGFINIKFNRKFWNYFLKEISKTIKTFGSNKTKDKNKYLIEFVSANPTGPLHVGHCRGAILGDVISNLLIFNGKSVKKEYYINDHGNQIIDFTKSVYFRIIEIKKKKAFPDDENLYPGDYIKDIAKKILKKKKFNYENFDKIYHKLSKECIKESMNFIKDDLKKLGIKHDNFVSESNLIKKDEVKKTINFLEKKKLVFKNENKLWFKSSFFGDDKDRALQKDDKTWSYFAGDVGYHKNKINRKFNKLINILGADHTGYIKRISYAVEALTGSKDYLNCKVSQLVKLIKGGEPFKMSKRKGDYITVDDLVKEVGKDPARFIMLGRNSDVELVFNFESVKEKTKDNPLFYVQYCFARINSILSKSKSKNKKPILKNDYQFNDEEIKIIKKLSEWPLCLEISTKKLEPHRIPIFLFELASEFHSYWNLGKQDFSKKFIDENNRINNNKLAFLNIISTTIKLGMNIIGVSTPNKM
tara:strand:+ start:1140 stop:2816 length:1677 start_codon:yes stop_codon:yes gene_type:complete